MRARWLSLVLCVGLAGCDDGGGATPDPADGSVPDAMAGDVGGDAIPMADSGGGGVAEPAVDPLFLDFGTVGVGDQAERDLVVSNGGDAPFTITGFEGLEGGYSISRQPPIAVPAGQERTLVVRFRPPAEGPAMQTLRITTDLADGTTLEVQLVGAGGSPEGMLASAVVDFGVVAPGDQTADFIRVTNISDGVPLTIVGVDGVEPPFSIPEGQIPAFADPGQDAEVLVQFAPEDDGVFEQEVTVRTDGGVFEVTLRGQSLSVGDLVVRGVEPAWAPTDAATTLVVHGGPFAAAPDAIIVGDVALEQIERVDASRVRGVLPAGGEALGTDADQLDVRVEIGGQFGVLPRGLIRTGPVEAGAPLDAMAVSGGMIGPAGNPWTLMVEAIPAGEALVIAPGTVVLADGLSLTVEGALRAGDEPGLVVFSARDIAPGAWGGLRFPAAEVASSLTDTVVEYAGADGEPALRIGQAASLVRIAVRASAGPGVVVDPGGTLTLLGAQLTDLAGDAMQMLAADGGWFRLSDTWVRRAEWPIAAAPNHFGRIPLGPGHDWADNAHEGIGIGGEIAEAVSLSNQPEPLVYALRAPLTVAAAGSLTLATAAPLRLDGVLTVNGRLVLPGGVRIEGAAGGRLVVGGGATLVATGTPDAPVTFEARAPGGDPQPGAWDGVVVQVGASLEATRLIVRDGGAAGPALDFEGAAGMLNGVRVEDALGVGLRLDGVAQLSTLELRGNPGGVLITGGAGRLSGVTEDAAPAVHFDPPALCADWNVDELLDGVGQPASTDCP